MKRFKANGNGCPAFDGKTRYFIDIKEVNRECSSNGYVTAYKGGKFWFPLSDPGEVFDCGKSDDFASLDWAINSADTIEVEEKHLPYLKRPEWNYEFRKADISDSYLGVRNTGTSVVCMDTDICSRILSGYRWCKTTMHYLKIMNLAGDHYIGTERNITTDKSKAKSFGTALQAYQFAKLNGISDTYRQAEIIEE